MSMAIDYLVVQLKEDFIDCLLEKTHSSIDRQTYGDIFGMELVQKYEQIIDGIRAALSKELT